MVMAGALQWLRAHEKELTGKDVAVVLIPDSGFRYLNKIFDDRWMQDHGFMEKEPAITAAQLLAGHSANRVISVAPDATLAEAVDLMTEHGISQVPVLQDTSVVGSLEETGILRLLIREPDARARLVQDVMGDPLPVVEPSLPVEKVSAHLEKPPGAVLIATDEKGVYRIITKSDMIRVLSQRNSN